MAMQYEPHPSQGANYNRDSSWYGTSSTTKWCSRVRGAPRTETRADSSDDSSDDSSGDQFDDTAYKTAQTTFAGQGHAKIPRGGAAGAAAVLGEVAVRGLTDAAGSNHLDYLPQLDRQHLAGLGK